MKSVLLIGGLGVAIGALGGYNFVYKSQQAQAQGIQTRIAEEGANQQAQADVATLLKQIQEYRKRLPSAPDTSRVAREVMGLAQQAGVKVTNIIQDAPQEFQSYTRLSVNLQFDATYHQLGTFVDAVERSKIFLHIDRIDVSQPGSAEGPASIRLALSTIYVAAPGGAAASP